MACYRDGRRTTLSGVTTAGPAQGTEVTAREAEVLALIARHLTNAQIAESLFISQRTVESHVSAMLRKLQLPDRRSLARHAEAIPRGFWSSPAGAGCRCRSRRSSVGPPSGRRWPRRSPSTAW